MISAHAGKENRLILLDRKFFPSDATTSAKTDEPTSAEASSSKVAETGAATANPEKLEKELPEPPKDEPKPKTAEKEPAKAVEEGEPTVKKLKSSHDPTADIDDDWEKIEKPSVPHKVTVEDVEDEDDKKPTY
jgi:hypothetical protein